MPTFVRPLFAVRLTFFGIFDVRVVVVALALKRLALAAAVAWTRKTKKTTKLLTTLLKRLKMRIN